MVIPWFFPTFPFRIPRRRYRYCQGDEMLKNFAAEPHLDKENKALFGGRPKSVKSVPTPRLFSGIFWFGMSFSGMFWRMG